MPQDQGLALGLGQRGQDLGQPQYFLVPLGPAGWAWIGPPPANFPIPPRRRPGPRSETVRGLRHASPGPVPGWNRPGCRPAFAAASKPFPPRSGRETGPFCDAPPGAVCWTTSDASHFPRISSPSCNRANRSRYSRNRPRMSLDDINLVVHGRLYENSRQARGIQGEKRPIFRGHRPEVVYTHVR